MMFRYADLFAAMPTDRTAGWPAFYNLFVAPATTLRITELFSGAMPNRTLFVYMDAQRHIHTVHTIVQHRVTADYPNGHSHNKWIGVFDEVHDCGVNLVSLDPDAFFSAVTANDTPSVEAVADAYVADTTARQVTAAAGAATSNVTTRYATPVPPELAAPLLRALEQGRLGPRDLFALVVAQNLSAQWEVDHAPFLDWLCVICGGGVNAANPMHTIVAPTRIHADACLGASRAAIRDQDAGPTNMLASLAPLVAATTETGRLAREADDKREQDRVNRDAEAAARKKSPSGVWLDGLERLLRLAQVADDLLLPAIWLRIAELGKGMALSALLTAVAARPQDPTRVVSIFGRLAVTQAMATAVASLQFLTEECDLISCLSIFLVTITGGDAMRAANQQANFYVSTAMLGISSTATEYMNTTKAIKLCLPATFTQLIQVLANYHRWTQILLGEAHVLPDAILAIIQQLTKQIAAGHESRYASVHQCTLVLFAIQKHVAEWVQEQEQSPQVVALRLDRVIEKLKFDDPLVQGLPSIFTQMIKEPPSSSSRAVAVAGTSGSSPRPSETPVPVELPLAQRVQGVYDGRADLAQIMAEGPPPRLANNKCPCLKFHVQGKCNTKCKYAHDHIPHTEEYTEILRAFLATRRPGASA